eukprot:TRINITY_DN3870_c0_g1_i12.p2 TRINITY_DN3870_c0_g1~~TRINITY_DN3870_c0_g1_i12.p2  ORF type:complete len:366 (-),score=72.91 TRINITY_DN3870_c0_g1_i12:124-1221(-)
MNRPLKFEYKYFVAKSEDSREVIRWEDSGNRVMAREGRRKPFIQIHDMWEHRRVALKLKVEVEEGKTVCVIGDCETLCGEGGEPIDMEKRVKVEPLVGDRQEFWYKSFYVPTSVQRITYRYLLKDEKGNNVMERQCSHRLHLNEMMYLNTGVTPPKFMELLPKKLGGNEEKPAPSGPKTHYRGNTFKRVDDELRLDFLFHKIDHSLLIGPYPQNEDDINELYNCGVRAVLNLQTPGDMKKRGVKWEEIKNVYKEKGFIVINYSIRDMDPADMASKAYHAAELLNFLVNLKKKVYVHCTAGIGRAPQTVVAYLCFFKNFLLNDAVEYVVSKRPYAKPNKECLEHALESRRRLYEKRAIASDCQSVF